MASNIQELVSGLANTLQHGLEEASRTASEAPDRFANILSEVADDVAELPQSLWDKLKQAAEHPDWLSLMILAAIQLRDAIGDPPLKVSAHDPGEGWSRALLLLLTQPMPAGGDMVLGLSVALGGEGKNGFIISARNTPKFEFDVGSVRIKASASSDIELWIPFGDAVVLKDGSGVIEASLQYDRLLVDVGDEVFGFAIGVPSIGGTITAGRGQPVSFAAQCKLGDKPPAKPGLQLNFNPREVLGPLAGLINVTALKDSYTPIIRVSSGADPFVDLGYVGS
jgi:hypothetical protein